MRVHSFSTLDGKIFVYDLNEELIQEVAKKFTTEIFFTLTDEEESLLTEVEEPRDNLKNDFIYFTAKLNGTSFWTCTCGNFLETDTNGEDRMLKRTVRHARKTGHTINPRGN